jgi:flagellar hook-associated protein 3 FlgL
MRVTENMNYDVIRTNMGRSKDRMENLQTQSATMKKLNTPSDNPVGAAKVLEVRTEKMNNDQYLTNAKMVEAYLANSEQALTEISDLVVRAKEIAIGQASGASSNAETRLGVAEEVSSLYQQAVSAANRRIGDRYLFGGYKTNKPPVDPDGKYQGDGGQMMIEIAKDVFLSMNVPGVDAFNTNPKGSEDAQKAYAPPQGQIQGQHKYEEQTTGRAPASLGQVKTGSVEGEQGTSGENVNVFDELQSLRIGLLTGDMDGIRGTLERFDQIHGKLVSTRSKIGSRLQGLQQTSQAIDRHNLTNATMTSQIEDADMAQVVSDLAKEEQVFKSTLASSQKLIQPTLLDFLR